MNPEQTQAEGQTDDSLKGSRERIESEHRDSIDSVKESIVSTLQLGKDTIEALSDIVRLIVLESSLALRALPKIAGLSFVLFCLSIGFWLSLCSVIGQVCYELTGSIAVGFTGFLLPQILLMGAIVIAIKRLNKRLKFTYTKKTLTLLFKSNQGDQNV